ncbi:ECF RNA polymerase sigma factor SigE [Caprobacter fermentans]|uniref:ECF RNA polymerase sigma factor SigE n=1 Tax=Caproicibacter fermentans TaxID=2576756 RepID=A0A6N8HZM5_9FIRM|nr:sigma-70 family RNA polymerase sigma factor [Caproicibacter fermentans]MVB11045.1 ECF RNA polymerase sigma factor SigE [Caproicibacter fermentans]
MLPCIMAIENEEERQTMDQLYRQNYKLMLYIAKGILKDQSKAEDAVSQTFVKIIEKFQKFSFEDCNKTKGLVVILVKHICYNMLREESHHSQVSLDEENFQADSFDLPCDHLLTEETYRALQAELNRLDEKFRIVLELKYVYDYSHEEIAQLLDISPGNARVRLHRAKAALAKAMNERGFHGE